MDWIGTAQRILSSVGIQVNLAGFLVLFGLTLARVLVAITLAPFFGGQAVPGRVRVGLGVILAALLAPNLRAPANFEISPLLFVALAAKEILTGAMLGIVCQFVFYGIQMAGVLIDTQRGMNQLTYVAPQIPGPASVLGQLQIQIAIVVFLVSGGHLMYLRALDESFRTIPVLDFPKFHGGAGELLETMGRLSADALLIALQMAAPVLLTLLLVDVAFGILGRVAQQINVHSESQPVKALAGLGMFLLVSGLLVNRIQAHLGTMLDSVGRILHSLKP
jgi:flagellar biosynthesis protein FliR